MKSRAIVFEITAALVLVLSGSRRGKAQKSQTQFARTEIGEAGLLPAGRKWKALPSGREILLGK